MVLSLESGRTAGNTTILSPEHSFRKNVVLNQSCCRPSPPPFSFGTSSFRGVERVSIKARVLHCGRVLSPIALASLRSALGMRDRLGPTSCVCSFRTTQNEGNGTREGVGQGVSSGGYDSEVQRKTSRHERGRGGA